MLAERWWPALDPQGTAGLVSVVLVYWRGAEDLRRCLHALRGQREVVSEVIVVENGSDMGDVAPEGMTVRRVHLPGNLGFAAAANAGARAARGEFLWFLNPDVEPASDCLAQLTRVLRGEWAAAQPLLCFAHDSGRIENVGFTLGRDGLNRARGRGLEAPAPGSEEPVLVASGAALLVRREALAEVGLFDPSYFAYGEDADLCLRLSRAGWRVAAVPSARATHRWSSSLGPWSLRKVFLIERNRSRVLWTHVRAADLPFAPIDLAVRLASQLRPAGGAEDAPVAGPGWRLPVLPLVCAAAWAAAAVRWPGSWARRLILAGAAEDPGHRARLRAGRTPLRRWWLGDG